MTEGCVTSAAQLLQSMDESVDPCDDFYQFTCGKFIKDTKIREDETSVNVFSKIRDKVSHQLRTMIEEPIGKDESRIFRLTKMFFQSCMNKTAIEEDGLKTINEMIKNYGGWPIIEGYDWNEYDFSWLNTLYKFRDDGHLVDFFFDTSVGSDMRNTTRRTITVSTIPSIATYHLIISFLRSIRRCWVLAESF